MDNNNPHGTTNAPRLRKLIVFFAILNIADGLGDAHGLMDQPLTFVLKEVHGWAPDAVTLFQALLMIPCLIRPLYGLVSDLVPIFGYRRKSYLILSNALVLAACLWLSTVTDPLLMWIGLFVTSFGVAVNSTVSGALTIENGKESGLSATFLNNQWMWFCLAQIVVSISGGWLAQHYAPQTAFRYAALVVAVAPLVLMIATVFLVEERKGGPVAASMPSAREVWRQVFSKQFLVVAIFLFLYGLQPSFYTPLYYHMSDTLQFGQDWIGILHGVWYLGAAVGTLAYPLLEKRMSLTGLIKCGVVAAALGHLSYLLLSDFPSALAVNFFAGVTSTIAAVSCMSLAAEYTPAGSEGFCYALLLAVGTIAGQVSSNLGSVLYAYVFQQQLYLLILAAFACTIANLFTLRILRLAKRADQAGNDGDGK